MTERVVFWDFDGTLAFRRGMWSGCLVETLDEHEPGHGIEAADLRPFLRDGFPWHRPEKPHPELGDPGRWWGLVEGILARAYEGVGFSTARGAELAALAHTRYVDPSIGWELYPETVDVLVDMRQRGWSHVVLSNHVPELREIACGLGLCGLLHAVLTSAETGYEKPHPEAFARALRACGSAHDRAWMVGDNPVADVAGARAVGIDAVLVRNDSPSTGLHAADLRQAAELIRTAARS